MRVALALVVCLLCGCSTFKKEWKAAGKNPAPAGGIEGRWEGEWRSDKNGHHGLLRCVVSQSSSNSYRAHFYAKFFKILHYTYVANLNGSETNGVVTLAGEANLGKLAGGVYTYKGLATDTNFQATYECKWDHGKFQMGRP